MQSQFTYLSGAQLHSMYAGEGEAALQAAFNTARACAPAVLFIDEVDSIAGEERLCSRRYPFPSFLMYCM